MFLTRMHENKEYLSTFDDDDKEEDSYSRKIWRKCRDSYGFYTKDSTTKYLSKDEIINRVANDLSIKDYTVKKYISIPKIQSLNYSVDEDEEIDVTDELQGKNQNQDQEINPCDIRNAEDKAIEKENITCFLEIADDIWKNKEDSDVHLAVLFTAFFVQAMPNDLEKDFLRQFEILNNWYLDSYYEDNDYCNYTYHDIDAKYNQKDSTNKRKRFIEKIEKRFNEKK